ncbi:MAG: response regulator [Candidatus Omnitrophota bacterium]
MAKRILVVDDETEICDIIKIFLTKKGFEVLAVQCGEDAMALLAKETVDLLILDKKMPGIGGLGVFWELKKVGRHIPAIIMTGSRRMPGYEEDYQKMGYADLLYKPVSLDELLESINKVIGD